MQILIDITQLIRRKQKMNEKIPEMTDAVFDAAMEAMQDGKGEDDDE